MDKYILSLDDLYDFFSGHKRSAVFSAEKSGYNIAVAANGFFELVEDRDSEGLLFCCVRALHDLKNNNKSYIDTEVLRRGMASMRDRPIMADIVETGVCGDDGVPLKDFAGHSMFYDDDAGRFVYVEKPVGHFVNPEGFSLEYDEAQKRNFVRADCVIYEEYSEACNILRRRKSVSCSVELIIRDMAYNAKSGELVINDFYVQGCTLLGADFKPGMDGARISLRDFSEDNNSVFAGARECKDGKRCGGGKVCKGDGACGDADERGDGESCGGGKVCKGDGACGGAEGRGDGKVCGGAELFAAFFTVSELERFEMMRANYSVIEDELRGYREREELAKKEAVLSGACYADFLDSASFLDIRKNIASFSVDEFEGVCDMALGREMRARMGAVSEGSAGSGVSVSGAEGVSVSSGAEGVSVSGAGFFAFAPQRHEGSFLDGLLGKM